MTISKRLMFLMALGFISSIVPFFVPTYTMAQELVAAIPVAEQQVPDTVIAWGQIMMPVLLTLASVLALVISELLRRLLARFGIELDAAKQEKVNQALITAANVGVGKAVDLVKDRTIDVRSTAVAEGIKYFKESWPDLVAKLGWNEQKIADAITGRINSHDVPTTIIDAVPLATAEIAAAKQV